MSCRESSHLMRKELGFYSKPDNWGLPDNIIIKDISPNDYNFIIEDSFSTQVSYAFWLHTCTFKENSYRENIFNKNRGIY